MGGLKSQQVSFSASRRESIRCCGTEGGGPVFIRYLGSLGEAEVSLR